MAWTNTTDLSAQFTLQSRLLRNAAELDSILNDQESAGRAQQLALDFVQTFGQASPEVQEAAARERNEAERLRSREIDSRVHRALGIGRREQVVQENDDSFLGALNQWNHFFRVLNLPVPPDVGTTLDAYVRYKADELRARPFTTAFLAQRMSDAEQLLTTIIDLTDWADARMPQDAALLNDLHLSLSNLTVSFTAAAEAQRAWWLLDQYQADTAAAR
jgi:hypothetical protein